MGTESTSRGRATGRRSGPGHATGLALGACTALVALALALPALADPVGNQVRVSQMGPDGNANFEGFDPDVVYNPTTNQSLAVWRGDNATNGEFEIFGRLIDANGNPIGVQVRLSDMGADGDANFDAQDPAVTYNPQTNEFLVVWEGDDVTNNEFEIYGQRVTAAGAEIGTNDFRISDMGPDGNANYDARNPAVTHNSQSNEFLAVWDGDDNTPPLVDNEFEIFGQRLSAGGNEAGTNDFRISDMGPNGNTLFSAFNPTVVYSATSNEFLAAWDGDDDTPPLVDNEREIFGQRLNATGGEIGTNDFRISDLGPDGNANFDAFDPNAAWNSQANQYLVAFEGDDDTAPLVDNEKEMFGQLLNAAGGEIGTNDFRISDMGPDGNANFDAQDNRRIAYSSQGNEFLVTWEGDDDTPPLVDNEREIFGQRLDALGLQIGTNDFRISQMGPDGDANFDADDPATTYNSQTNQYQTVWEADDNPPLAPNEEEIFGRLAISGAPPPASDTTAPTLSLRGPRTQNIRRVVRVRVRSNEDAAVRATGKITVPGTARASASVRLRAGARTVPADKTRTVKLRLTSRARRAVRRALRRASRRRTARARRRAARRIRARIKVTATDGAGNKTSKRRTIRAKTPRRR